MDWVFIVLAIALVEYSFFGIQVGRARSRFDVPAPAITGHPEFERYFRVQQNTAEQLLIFVPALLVYGYVGNPIYAAIAGVVFIIGRAVYFVGYVKDPKSRAAGFVLTFLPNVYMLVAILYLSIESLI